MAKQKEPELSSGSGAVALKEQVITTHFLKYPFNKIYIILIITGLKIKYLKLCRKKSGNTSMRCRFYGLH